MVFNLPFAATRAQNLRERRGKRIQVKNKLITLPCQLWGTPRARTRRSASKMQSACKGSLSARSLTRSQPISNFLLFLAFAFLNNVFIARVGWLLHSLAYTVCPPLSPNGFISLPLLCAS